MRSGLRGAGSTHTVRSVQTDPAGPRPTPATDRSGLLPSRPPTLGPSWPPAAPPECLPWVGSHTSVWDGVLQLRTSTGSLLPPSLPRSLALCLCLCVPCSLWRTLINRASKAGRLPVGWLTIVAFRRDPMGFLGIWKGGEQGSFESESLPVKFPSRSDWVEFSC